MSPWQVLGVARDATAAEVRGRYAALIKQFRPDTHPEEFSRVREAYEAALPVARRLDAQRQAQAAADEAAPPVPQAPRAGMVEVAGAAAAAPAAREATGGISPGMDSAAAAPEPAPPEMPVRVTAEPAPAVTPVPRVQVDTRSMPKPPRAVAAEPPAPRKPSPAEQVAALRAQAEREGEQAALTPLRTLLARGRRDSLDDRQALEFALLQWFLQVAAPPLALMFDAGRAFAWHRHEGRLAPWLGAERCRQLELLLTLARDAAFARHAASNAWLRRLFTPQGRAPWFGSTLAMAEARGWEARWRALAASAGQPDLMGRLNERVGRRLSGFVVSSTDLFTAACLVAVLWPWLGTLGASSRPAPEHWGAWLGALGTLCLAPVVAALRVAGAIAHRRLKSSPQLAWWDRLSQWGHSLVILLAGAFLVMVVLAVSSMEDTFLAGLFFRALAVGALALMGGAGLWFAWHCVLLAERIVHAAVSWRESVDRWEFGRWLTLQPEAPADPGPAIFGPRLRWWQRLGKAREARVQERLEIQRRERPPRLTPLKQVPAARRAAASNGGKGSKPRSFQLWWVWLAIALLQAIARLHS